MVILGLAQWWFKDPTINLPNSGLSFGYVVESAGEPDNAYLPMLVALHGNGDTADNFYATAMDQFRHPARIILLKGPISKGSGSAWPWSAADFKIYGKAVSEAIALLATKFPTTGKPMLMGFSGGGMMAYYQAAKYGSQYSYVFPISGQLTLDQLGDLSANPGAKVHAYHGRNDAVLSISGGRNAVKILRENGVQVELTEFEGGHLGVFDEIKPLITRTIEKKLADLS